MPSEAGPWEGKTQTVPMANSSTINALGEERVCRETNFTRLPAATAAISRSMI